MRWSGCIVIVALGCAAPPAPKVAEFARASRTEKAPLAITNDKAAIDEPIKTAISSGEFAAAILKDTPEVCAELSNVIAYTFAGLEPAVLSALREARGIRESNISALSTERDVLAWHAYDAIVDTARASVLAKAAPWVETYLFVSPNVSKELDRITAAGDDARETARERASAVLHSEFEAAAATCVDLALDGVRGRWVAAFKGKL